jgi:carbon-monoxide dehydrogenase large subunit
MAAPTKFGVGQSVPRKEDDALIRGKGRYTDDFSPQPAMHALVLRSPHAHAKFTIDVGKARGLPGVALIPTAADVGDLGDLPCLFNLETEPFTGPPYPILPKDERCAMLATPSPSWWLTRSTMRAMPSRRSTSNGRRCRRWSASSTQ